MKTYRNLFYILIVLFVIGIVWVCFANPLSVLSRIASGLITGSFVGAITMFVNYIHLRTSYFEKMSAVLMKIGHELGNDYIDVMLKNEELALSTSQDVVNDYSNRTTEQKREMKSQEKKYQKLIKKINKDAFSGIFISDIAVKRKLGNLEEILFRVEDMYNRYRANPYFKSLPAKASAAIQSQMIGDPQQFYNNWVQSNQEFKDDVATEMMQLGTVCKDLSTSLVGPISKDVSSIMSVTSEYFSYTHVGDLETIEDEQDFDEGEDEMVDD